MKAKKNKIEIKAKDNELIFKRKWNSKNLLQRLYCKHQSKKLGSDEVKRNKKFDRIYSIEFS